MKDTVSASGNEQTYLSRISYELLSLVQICPFGRAGFRARVQRDVYRRKTRYPSGMLRSRDPHVDPAARSTGGWFAQSMGRPKGGLRVGNQGALKFKSQNAP